MFHHVIKEVLFNMQSGHVNIVQRRTSENKELQTSNVKYDMKRIGGFIFKKFLFQLYQKDLSCN